MKKTIRKSLGIKVLGVVNCLALCLTAYTANLACNWLYYQEEEPEEVKKMRLFEVQNRNGILEEKDRRLYEYAYGVLLGRVAIYLIIVILGIVTGNWLEMLVFLLPFTVLRQYAGGIHLEKAGSCMVVSSILVLLCGQYLASGSAVMWQIRIIWLAAVGVIFVMAPVDASSKKLDEKEKKVYGMRARAILIIECAIAGVFSVTGYFLVVNGIMVAHIVLASGLILGWIKNFF